MKSSPIHTSRGSRAIFFVPFAYFIATRLHGKSALASWIMIYPVPLLISVIAYSGEVPAQAGLMALALAIVATYTLYELGYMDNDTRTVRRETNPTERLSSVDKAFYEKWRWLIVASRLAIVVIACLAIERLADRNEPGLRAFYAGLLVLAAVFPAYNSIRGRTNLALQFLLVACRFCLPGMLLIDMNRAGYFSMMIVAFPLINLLERSGERRYRLAMLAPILKYKNLSRVLYYSIAVVGVSALGEVRMPAMVIFGYFLVYRLVSPALSRFVARRVDL